MLTLPFGNHALGHGTMAEPLLSHCMHMALCTDHHWTVLADAQGLKVMKQMYSTGTHNIKALKQLAPNQFIQVCLNITQQTIMLNELNKLSDSIGKYIKAGNIKLLTTITKQLKLQHQIVLHGLYNNQPVPMGKDAPIKVAPQFMAVLFNIFITCTKVCVHVHVHEAVVCM
jgi:hypothetical protein